MLKVFDRIAKSLERIADELKAVRKNSQAESAEKFIPLSQENLEAISSKIHGTLPRMTE